MVDDDHMWEPTPMDDDIPRERKGGTADWLFAVCVLTLIIFFISLRINAEKGEYMSWKKEPQVERIVTSFKVSYTGKEYFINFDHDTSTWHVWGTDMHIIGSKKVIREPKENPQVNFRRASFVLKTKLKYAQSKK